MGLCKIWLFTVESNPGGVGQGVFLLGIGAGPPPAELGAPAALTWLLWVAELSLQQRPRAGRPTGPASRREARSPAQAGAQNWLPGPGRGQASKERSSPRLLQSPTCQVVEQKAGREQPRSWVTGTWQREAAGLGWATALGARKELDLRGQDPAQGVGGPQGGA